MISNLVKALILAISISSSLQNVTTSETAMKVYETGDYRGDFSQYYIGPYLDSGEPLKFKLSFDMETYRNDRASFVFCLCFPSTQDDILGSVQFYCKSSSTAYSSRICLHDNHWYVKNMRDKKVDPIVNKGMAEIEIVFYPTTVQAYPTVTVTSHQFNPNHVVIESNNFKKFVMQNHESWIKIGAYSNRDVSIKYVPTNYTIVKVIPDSLPIISTSEKPNVSVAFIPPGKEVEATSSKPDETNSAGVILIVIGVLIGLLVLAAIIIIILRFVQGIWCCGLIGKKKSKSSEDGPPQSVKIQLQKGFTKSSDEKHRSPSSTVPETAGQESTGQLQQDGDGAKEIIPPVTPPAPPPPPPPPPPPAPLKEKKAEKPVVSRETKDTTGNVTTDEKESDGETDGATTGATTTVAPTTTAAAAEKKKERVPNMLLLATKEEDTQSEGQIPSKRKTKVEKHNKEPAPTKNVTQDPGAPATKGIATGKAAATTMKVVTGVQKTQAAKTGLPKSETDLVTDEKAGTKGVSATQGDKTTAAKGTTQVAPTQTFVGTQTTQGGGGATGAGKTKTGMATGVGNTRLTGATQMPTADTNETQYPTGATKTKPTQFATGATQRTGTTQAGTGTTQRGTTMATGKTQIGTNPTQARTGGTRQTGETQNPDEADIDFTQIPGTVATHGSGGGTGGTRPTQFPSDADADPTQNPTAFTGGGEGGKTSKTQFGATGTNQTQAGTSKTRTRDTQKQTNRTDAAL